MKPLAFGLLSLLILTALAAPAAAEHRGVTLYKHVHFRGHSETFDRDVPNLGWTSIGNDRASSIAVPRGCRVTLYGDADFRGLAITVRHDVDDLGATWLGNDEVSSLAIDCRGRRGDGYGDTRRSDRHRYERDRGHQHGPACDHGYDRSDDRGRRYDRGHGAVTVFEDDDFRGASESFAYSDPDLRDNYLYQDTASSVYVEPGCRAVLYADVGFRGAATVVTGGEDNLGHTAVGNDRVSSIQVECGR